MGKRGVKDIEVNEYVRLARNQGINKIIDIYDKKYELETDIANEWGEFTCILEEYQLKDEIINHSKQLIDLIEDKDIVEIELSEEFVEKKDKKKLIQIGDIYTKEILQKDIDNGIITRILTILPYNQYMANCYKVGGEDDEV